MHSPANCPAAVPEHESGFFRNPLPGSPPEKFAPSRNADKPGNAFFHPLFHKRGQVKNNNKLAFQTFSGTLSA